MNEGYVTIAAQIDTTDFDAEIKYITSRMEDIEDKIKQADLGFEVGDTMKLEAEYSKLSKQLVKLVNKQNELNKPDFSRLNSSIEKVVGKITKWGLALFGIRSAYNFIRSAVNQVAQEDEKISTQIEYITYAVGTLFKPIFEFILNVVYKIIGGIGAIIKLITGVNIFANATAENFKKANNSAKGLRKTLASFDEANVLGGGNNLGLASDINKTLENMGDLSTEVDNIGRKIKRWFIGGDSIQEGINNSIKKIKNDFTPIANWINENAIKPTKDFINQFVIDIKPLWQPLYNEAKNTIDNQLKPLWNDFFENHLKPMWGGVSRYVETNAVQPMKGIFVPFFNDIINWINRTFGVFGIQLDYIELESQKSASGIKGSVGTALDTIKNKANDLSNGKYNVNIVTNQIENANNGTSSLSNSLKNLTSKTWKIATQFSTTLDSKSTPSILEGLRGALKKVGITLPKLAVGGIVNMPGKGITYGGANIGENGAEGVIPLTNSQSLDMIADAIGSRITVNLTNVTELDGRTIARKVQEVSNNTNFLLNR